MSYKIVTDSTADMDWTLWDAEVIKMDVSLDGEPYSYGPGGSLDVAEFYRRQKEGARVSTSQISPDAFMRFFKPLLDSGEDILYLCFSSGLSGTYQSACIAFGELREKYPDRTLICIDSLAASIREGFLVYEACRRKKEGMDISQLENWVKDSNSKIDCQFTVDDLETLRQGGRISRTTALVGGALQIKPMLGIDESGCLAMTGKVRGRRKSMDALIEYYETNRADRSGETAIIGHGDAEADAAALAERVREIDPAAETVVCPIGPVIGVHTGPGMLAICFYKK